MSEKKNNNPKSTQSGQKANKQKAQGQPAQKAPAQKAAAKAPAKKASQFPSYKGRPLVRSGDTIYYGSMKDKYVIKMQVKSKKDVGGLQVADKVAVQLMYTDPEIRSRKQIVKTSEKAGLYLALDIAEVWLDRALTEGAEEA